MHKRQTIAIDDPGRVSVCHAASLSLSEQIKVLFGVKTLGGTLY